MWNARAAWFAGALVTVAAGLAGCNGSGGSLPLAPGSSVEGEWVGGDGATLTRFQGGSFTTTLASTGETLSDGTYRMVDRRTVQIAMRSVVRQTETTVTCALVSAQNLACTSPDGGQFNLTRRAAG